MKSALASLTTHGLIVATMAWILAHDDGHVAGTSGLVGKTRTRFDVTMESKQKRVTPKQEEVVEKIPVAREGIALPKELPTEVKNAALREIDSPPELEKKIEHSGGNFRDAPIGAQGQGGASKVAADRIGDSDRTNRLGLYLQKMQRKIQANLGPAGYVEFPSKAKLLLDLKRDGRVTKISVLESSGDSALDRLAIRAVEKSLPFDPWEEDQKIQLPVVFR